jgi:hypothetical protein
MVIARAEQGQDEIEWQDRPSFERVREPSDERDRRQHEVEDKTPAPAASPVVRLIEQTRAERRAHHDRVANLFPRPETTEWNVREIAYDRRRRAEVS